MRCDPPVSVARSAHPEPYLERLLITKLEALADRHQEVSALLGDAETAADQNRFRDLSKEFSHLNEVVSHYQQWMRLGNTLADARQCAKRLGCRVEGTCERGGVGGRASAAGSGVSARYCWNLVTQVIKAMLEIRAGTGGDEAAIFSGDLFRMYHRYAEQKGGLSKCYPSALEHGYKELITRVGDMMLQPPEIRVRRASRTAGPQSLRAAFTLGLHGCCSPRSRR